MVQIDIHVSVRVCGDCVPEEAVFDGQSERRGEEGTGHGLLLHLWWHVGVNVGRYSDINASRATSNDDPTKPHHTSTYLVQDRHADGAGAHGPGEHVLPRAQLQQRRGVPHQGGAVLVLVFCNGVYEWMTDRNGSHR